MCKLIRANRNDAQVMQRLVNVCRFAEHEARRIRFPRSFGPREVDKVELRMANDTAALFAPLDRDRENAVGARRREIQRRLGDCSIRVTDEEHVERVFLRCDDVLRETA